jgi:hypothetical protein
LESQVESTRNQVRAVVLVEPFDLGIAIGFARTGRTISRARRFKLIRTASIVIVVAGAVAVVAWLAF